MGGGADDFGEDNFIISSMRAGSDVSIGYFGGGVHGMMSGCGEMFVVGVVDGARWLLMAYLSSANGLLWPMEVTVVGW